MKKTWTVPTDEGEISVVAEYTLFVGALTVSIGEDTFSLPNKFLTGLFGRKESFKIDDKLAFLVIRPFGSADIVIKGKYLSSGKDYR